MRKYKAKLITLAFVSSSLLMSFSPMEENASRAVVLDLRYWIVESLTSPFHLDARAKTVTEYPSNYSSLNTTTITNIDRDYGTVKIDGKDHSAVIDYENGNGLTYYEDDKGKLVCDYYDYKGDILTSNVYTSLTNSYYENVYPNPFLYIDVSDINISDDYSLSTKKAELILNFYFGLTNKVDEAHFIGSFTNSETKELTGISFKIHETGGSYGTTTSGQQIKYTVNSEVTMSFDFSDIVIQRPSKSSEQIEKLDKAFSNIKDNFTLILSSDSMTNDVAYYVTSNGILVKGNYHYYGIQEGDYYYSPSSKGKYSKYQYSSTSGTEWLYLGEVEYSTILPDFTAVSSTIFYNDNNEIYPLRDLAKRYGPDYFAPIDYSLGEGIGQDGYVKLKGDNVSLISMKYSYSGSYVVYNEHILDLGTTELPEYFSSSDVL